MTEMLTPMRDLTYNDEIPMRNTVMVGFYPFDKMSMLTQEHIYQMATEAAELFVATMKILEHFSDDPTIIHALGSASIHNFVDNENEIQFTIDDAATGESLTMLYYKDAHELGQRFHINEIDPRPYNPNFTVKMNEIIGKGRVQGRYGAT